MGAAFAGYWIMEFAPEPVAGRRSGELLFQQVIELAIFRGAFWGGFLALLAGEVFQAGEATFVAGELFESGEGPGGGPQ